MFSSCVVLMCALFHLVPNFYLLFITVHPAGSHAPYVFFVCGSHVRALSSGAQAWLAPHFDSFCVPPSLPHLAAQRTLPSSLAKCSYKKALWTYFQGTVPSFCMWACGSVKGGVRRESESELIFGHCQFSVPFLLHVGMWVSKGGY